MEKQYITSKIKCITIERWLTPTFAPPYFKNITKLTILYTENIETIVLKIVRLKKPYKVYPKILVPVPSLELKA